MDGHLRATAVGLAAVLLALPVALLATHDPSARLGLVFACVIAAVIAAKHGSLASAFSVAAGMTLGALVISAGQRVSPSHPLPGMLGAAFAAGTLAPLNLLIGTLVGVLALGLGFSDVGWLGLLVVPAWFSGALVAEKAADFGGRLARPILPLPKSALAETLVFLTAFILTAVWFGAVYHVLDRELPKAFVNSPNGWRLTDYVATSIVILAAGEPTTLTPATTFTRLIFAAEVLAGVLWITFYFALLVARFNQRDPHA